MKEIIYYDRVKKKEEKEKVYGFWFLELLYGKGFLSHCFSFLLRPLFAHIPLFSHFYGYLQKRRASRFKVKPFIRDFQVDASEFLDRVESYDSFNDFFIRKLKAESRPIDPRDDVAILPADARYLVFPNIEKADGFWVKGKKFSLKELLKDDVLASRYAEGAMVIARLCPVDYHRFHFPLACVPGKARLINGPLYSVNPIALKRNISYLSENKRMITELETEKFGKVLYIEVGATHVGSILQTYTPKKCVLKEKRKGISLLGAHAFWFFSSQVQLFSNKILSSFLQKKWKSAAF